MQSTESFFKEHRLFVISSCILLLCAFAAITAYLTDKEAEEILQECPYDENCPVSLEGTYSIKSIDNGNTSWSTGAITYCEDTDTYTLEILSQFAPQTIELTKNEDGAFSCEELGCGTIVYKASSKSITINFIKNGNTTCVLTK